MTDGRLHEKALFDVLGGRKVVVCVGSGGVGKTTTAATLALRSAVEGKRAFMSACSRHLTGRQVRCIVDAQTSDQLYACTP